MILTIIKSILKKDFNSFKNDYPEFDKMIKDVELTMVLLMNALDSSDIITGNSVVSDYLFITDSNLKKCLDASAVIMSDKFSKRIAKDNFIIARPDYSPIKLSREDKEPEVGDELSAKDWNNFWKDVINWSRDSKPLTSIEKKPVLFNDLTGCLDGLELVSFEQGTLPLEFVYVMQYQVELGKKLSPIVKDVEELDLESWILNGLK